MKKISNILLILAGIILIIPACSKQADMELVELEDRIFENYLVANNISVEPTESGLYFIEETEGTGISPVTGDYVLINYSLYTIVDDALIYSTVKTTSERAGLYDSRILYGPNKFQVGQNLVGLDEGLTLMKEGGKAGLLFKSELGYGGAIKEPIDPYSSLYIEVELIEVIKDPAKSEYEKTIEYLTGFDIAAKADTTDTGIFYFGYEDGEGDSIKFGDYVTMAITGKLLDGRVFYQNDNYQVTVGSYEYDLTDGLNIGLTYMKQGGHSMIVVLYNKGFGEIGRNFYNYYVKTPIPPYSTLIYDVTIKSVN